MMPPEIKEAIDQMFEESSFDCVEGFDDLMSIVENGLRDRASRMRVIPRNEMQSVFAYVSYKISIH